ALCCASLLAAIRVIVSLSACYHATMHAAAKLVAACVFVLAVAPAKDPFTLDRDGARWVEQTLKKLSVDEKIGQVIVPAINATYLSSDSDAYDEAARLVRDYHVGGFHVFGGSEPSPQVLLNAGYGSVVLGQPLAAASLINRLQTIAAV